MDLQERDTRRALLTFAQRQLPGVVVGILVIVPAIVLSRWVSWLLLIPLIGVAAFIGFWWFERRRQSRDPRRL